MTTLRYHDHERLTPEQRAALSGPGAPFETTVERVLGADCEVFVQRPRSLVEVLRTSAEQFGDRAYLRFSSQDGPEETVTFAAVPERAGAVARVGEILGAEQMSRGRGEGHGYR